MAEEIDPKTLLTKEYRSASKLFYIFLYEFGPRVDSCKLCRNETRAVMTARTRSVTLRTLRRACVAGYESARATELNIPS